MTAAGLHQIAEGRQTVKTGENLIFSVDITKWSTSTPTVSSVTVFRESDNNDLTSTIIPTGSASVNGTVITLPEMIFGASLGLERYRVEVVIEVGGFSPGVFELPLEVID